MLKIINIANRDLSINTPKYACLKAKETIYINESDFNTILKNLERNRCIIIRQAPNQVEKPQYIEKVEISNKEVKDKLNSLEENITTKFTKNSNRGKKKNQTQKVSDN